MLVRNLRALRGIDVIVAAFILSPAVR